MDLDFQYLLRGLFFETSGHFTLQSNISLSIELTSSYDSIKKTPQISITTFTSNLNNLNILFGGSILGYLLDLIEGFCDCVVKEQYPYLIEKIMNTALTTILQEVNNKFLVNLEGFDLGLDLQMPQAIENTEDNINFFVNALFFDPYEPSVQPPEPTPLPQYNKSHEGIEITLNQGSLNSLLWSLNEERIFDFFIKGDQLPFSLPFPFVIDTKMFQLALPSLYKYYNETNRVIDLVLNTTDHKSPAIILSQGSVLLQFNETITFLVRLDDNSTDQAFVASFSLEINATISNNATFLFINLISFTNVDVHLVENKIPGLEKELDGLSSFVNSLLTLGKGIIDAYLEAHPIALPNIQGISLENFEILLVKENIVVAVEPVVEEFNVSLAKTMADFAKKTLKKLRV